MVSVIIPTYNRAYTIRKVLPSYYEQNNVEEVIVVDDAGSDRTREVVEEISAQHPSIKTIYIRNKSREGASAARKTGLDAASSEFVFFGEDDAFLDEEHISTLREFIVASGATVVSGRIVYLLPGESASSADTRIEHLADSARPYVDIRRLALDHVSKVNQMAIVPFTHALILARRVEILMRDFDPYYAKGNGFREETDFQITAAGRNGSIAVTEECRCYHFARQDVPLGGQRVHRLSRYYWAVRYTNYFVGKNFEYLSKFLPPGTGETQLKLSFAVLYMIDLFVTPLWKRLRLLSQSR